MIDLEPEIQIWRMTNIAMELAIKAHEAQPKKHWKETIPSYLHDFADVFEKKDFDELPPHCPWDHAIKLLPGSEERLDCKAYALNEIEHQALRDFIDENLKTGHIRPSISPMASPFFFIKKKDGSL
jgi:hypothetical protein